MPVNRQCQGFNRFFIIPGENVFSDDRYRSFQKSIFFQDVIAVIFFCECLVFQSKFFVFQGPAAEQGFISTGQGLHPVKLGRSNFFGFDILHDKPFFGNASFPDDGLAGAAGAEVVHFLHTWYTLAEGLWFTNRPKLFYFCAL